MAFLQLYNKAGLADNPSPALKLLKPSYIQLVTQEKRTGVVRMVYQDIQNWLSWFFLQKIMSDSDTESDDSYDSDSFLQNKEKPTPKWDLPRWENKSLTTMTNKSMTVIIIIMTMI